MATTPNYERAPSQELQDLLKPGGFLRPITKLNTRRIGGHEHDVHFRVNNEIHVYRGGRPTLRVRGYRRGWHVKVTTDEKHCSAATLCRRWSVEEPGFCQALTSYLQNVEVSAKWTKGEGAIQMLWSRVQNPWVPFDREAVLGYSPPASVEVETALDDLMVIYEARQNERRQQDRWAKPKIKSKKVDQLAVDRQGRLVLIELKDGSKRKNQVYYAPFQLLQYVWAWHSSLKLRAVKDNLQRVLDARVKLGLTNDLGFKIKGGIRAAVCFGCDTRSEGVKRSYSQVLEVVNQHLPAGVDEIETWEYTDNGPKEIYESHAGREDRTNLRPART